ncbi:MAG: hypothetical protein E3K33_09365 [Candidatus Brocadia sp.]|nr:hypothetical protein [Candidatus Brocadia fulgida]MDG5997144.1 hypothetical protein [Candidatus Brocadia sp.]
MFITSEVESLYRKSKPSIKKLFYFLNHLSFQECREQIDQLKNNLTVAKEEHKASHEEVLNEFYVLSRFVDMLSSYCDLWKKIIKMEFSSSWNSLQDALDQLRQVKKFSSRNTNQAVSFFENQLLELEKLYPYRVFCSVGITVERFECSICGRDIDTFDCHHTRGELYRGQMAYGIAHNVVETDHVAMVKHPADKRCVVVYDDNGEQFELIRFLSELITTNKLQPFDFGELQFSKKKAKNHEFQKKKRNSPCYCGSGKKFKKCCISKEYVNGDHVDIVAKLTNIEEIIG